MTLDTLAPWLGVSALLFLLVRAPRHDVSSPSLSLLRCLFPAWRFFEEITEPPRLSHRVIARDGTVGPWTPSLPVLSRTKAMLIWNATGNLQLAYQSVVEHLAADLEDAAAEPSRQVSYRLVQALVEACVRRELPLGAAGHYQFRLGETDGFVSPQYALDAA